MVFAQGVEFHKFSQEELCSLVEDRGNFLSYWGLEGWVLSGSGKPQKEKGRLTSPLRLQGLGSYLVSLQTALWQC